MAGKRITLGLKMVCPPDCVERSATCHATCPKYQAFYILQMAEYEKRHKLAIIKECSKNHHIEHRTNVSTHMSRNYRAK